MFLRLIKKLKEVFLDHSVHWVVLRHLQHSIHLERRIFHQIKRNFTNFHM